jgi:hypothetical protein
MGQDKTLLEPSAQKPQEAQQRADRIQAFWEEMQALEQEQALTLPEDQRRALRSHHDQILKTFSQQFQVDTTRVPWPLLPPYFFSFTTSGTTSPTRLASSF